MSLASGACVSGAAFLAMVCLGKARQPFKSAWFYNSQAVVSPEVYYCSYDACESCRPGHQAPHMSKSDSDMASKLFTFTFTFTHQSLM